VKLYSNYYNNTLY